VTDKGFDKGDSHHPLGTQGPVRRSCAESAPSINVRAASSATKNGPCAHDPRCSGSRLLMAYTLTGSEPPVLAASSGSEPRWLASEVPRPSLPQTAEGAEKSAERGDTSPPTVGACLRATLVLASALQTSPVPRFAGYPPMANRWVWARRRSTPTWPVTS